MRSFLLIFGLVSLIAVEILRVYFIMPFPGSQESNTIDIAYWLHQNIVWIRIVLLLIIVYPALQVFRQRKRWRKIVLSIALLFYAFMFYLFNFKFLADKMFYQPRSKEFAGINNNKIGQNKLVIGVEINGEAKAYPIQLIGYHHQVRDTVGNTPVMVTYCTVCRTGRVFSPFVNGKNEDFRLVGMDHFNAMFEDKTTKSWWRQVSGEAITGPLKGTSLKELSSRQMTLAAWLRQHPSSSIMQPDTVFKKDYEDLALFDNGTIKSGLEKRDSLSWKKKSWVVGLAYNGAAKAYDWNRLVKEHLIQDSLPNLPVVLALEKDTVNYHVWNRRAGDHVLHFQKTASRDSLIDRNTGSKWNMNGVCVDGPLKGKRLQPVQASQEFWHSWQSFHPNTLR